MTLIKPSARRLVIFYFLILYIFAGGSACYSAKGNEKTFSENTNVQFAENGSKNISPEVTTKKAKTETSVSEVEGWYQLKNYRAGKGGTVNLLIIKKLKNGNLSVSFEGTYAYQANGAETFHESEAAGELQLKGDEWRGNLNEEGIGETKCLVALNFSAGKVTLKSSECGLNVSPDGIYKNIPPQEEDETSAQTTDENSAENDENSNENTENADEVEESNADQSPRIEYKGKTPAAIVNLMAHEGEREGCETDALGFYGKVLKVYSAGDYDFEITLADDNGKRQKFSLVLAAEDKLPFKETRQIIKTGNYLEIAYLNCGNAPIASPTEIYLR